MRDLLREMRDADEIERFGDRADTDGISGHARMWRSGRTVHTRDCGEDGADTFGSAAEAHAQFHRYAAALRDVWGISDGA